MKHRKILYMIMMVLVVIATVCGIVIYQIYNSDEVTVAFLDVGQGDAILISKGSQQILIDGGPDDTVLMERLGKYIPFWDRNIEIVIATHPDSDHIDGLINLFNHYSVDQFWYTEASKDTSANAKLLHNVKSEDGLESIVAFTGLEANLDDVNLEVIHPFEKSVDSVSDINNTSIAIVMHVGNEVFYLGGDLSTEVEDVLPVNEDITVLKAGHHGSGSSTSKKFLGKAIPRDVIISAGKDNKYKHPHKDVLERILAAEAQVFRTDILGDIVYKCDAASCVINF